MSASESDSDSDCDYDSIISACVRGELDLVKRQVSKGADVTGDNCDAVTSLLETCKFGHCEILKYLITLGIDVNRTNADGETALHCSVADDQLECVKMLVENGARTDMKFKDMTPVQLASVDGEADIVEYFVQSPLCPRAVKIEALELLGAHYIDVKNNLESAAHYWLWSLRERERAEPGDNVPPKRDEPHPGFGNIREFQTEQELTAFSIDDVRMQSLIMRERIFGPQRTSCDVSDRAMVYAEEGNFDRSISLMTYRLDVEQESDGVRVWTLKRFCSHINMFEKLMFDGLPVKYKDVTAVLTKTVDVLEHNMQPHLDQPWNSTTFNKALYAVVRSISILSQLQPSISEDDRLQFRKVVCRFVQLNLRDRDGLTPLHLACVNNMTPFSPLAVVQLLLEVGADPQAVSLNGDTPLHTIAKNKHQTQPQIIKLLLSSGTHYDTCNIRGKCFTELLHSDNVFKLENQMKYLSLQCFSAKAVLRYAIPFESEVPSRVSEFIKMH